MAIALGMRGIETGFSVSFYRLDELMHQLKRDADLPPAKLKYRKYMAVNLVIIDEFGYQQLDREESNLFFRVVNYRYAKGRERIRPRRSRRTKGLLVGHHAFA